MWAPRGQWCLAWAWLGAGAPGQTRSPPTRASLLARKSESPTKQCELLTCFPEWAVWSCCWGFETCREKNYFFCFYLLSLFSVCKLKNAFRKSVVKK